MNNSNERWVHILSIDKAVKGYLELELKLLFGDKVNLTSSAIDEEVSENIKPTVVLASGEFLDKDARRLFPNSEILCARRDISCNNLDKVIALPRNKKVLVVNHPKGASDTTIESLVNMGFNHLEYIPYFIGADIDFDVVDTAISPAMMHLCPSEIKNKIDIGPRTISFSTLSHLLEILDLEESYLDQFLYQYNRGISSISLMLSEAFQRSEAMRNNFDIILDEIDDGIISMDEKENIIYMNSACKKLLNFNTSKIQKGKKIDEVLQLFKGYPKIKEEIFCNKSGVFNLYNKEIIILYVPLYEKSGENSMIIMKRVDELQKLEEDVRRILYKKGYTAKYTFEDVIGKSKEINKSINIAKRIAKSESTVIITGESGTGKEVFAQAIHNESLRSNFSFVAVNLASLPESLVESELFGYSDGAFTGARKGGRAGLFEQAHKGTIFIDEIGDISQTTQARLLRVLQEKEVMRIGDNKIINIDIRFIAATNRDLKSLVEQGKFREDLYYRLNVLPIHLPPLRERKEDIELFINNLLKMSKSNKKFSNEVMEVLLNYDWPGNVRELINVMEYLTQITLSNLVTKEELPPYLLNKKLDTIPNIKESENIDLNLPFGKTETEFILEALLNSQENNIRIGRKQLTKLGKQSGLTNITEDKIRTMLKHLEYQGLIIIGKTKQGTIITEKGKHYLGSMGEK